MKNFGNLKMKMLKKITDSYTKNDKKSIKKIINIIKEDKDFKELYLLYEDIENKYFEDEFTAVLYVDELSKSLKGIEKSVESSYRSLNKLLENQDVESNNVYNLLDQLIESDNLLNIDKKVLAKKDLVNYLLKKKEINLSENKVFTENENLLHNVLTNNFNVLYNSTLTEDQKNELKSILSLNDDQIKNKMSELKESINDKITELLKESNEDNEVKIKLNDVKNEMDSMKPSKYNLYRLKELKNGLS